jgi:hypothetical protein
MIGIIMRGESVPKSIEVPISIVIRPRYIGFLVYLNGPFVTIRVARVPGRGFVPNFRKNMPLPRLRENPRTIIIIPMYLQGKCNQRPIGTNELSSIIAINPIRK